MNSVKPAEKNNPTAEEKPIEEPKKTKSIGYELLK